MNARLAAVAAALLLASCSPPKYASYKSLHGDFTAPVPWGWRVMTDQSADPGDFAQVNFIGPFDPDFYLGAPSLSVRWYRHYRARRLRDGRLEVYTGAKDFIERTLREVYGPEARLETKSGGVEEIPLRGSGLRAHYFVVLSAAPAPESARWGVEEEADTGRPVNLRRHAYIVVPMGSGFYVLCYPATRAGFGKYSAEFNQLASGFLPASRGPKGRRVRLPGPGRLGDAADL